MTETLARADNRRPTEDAMKNERQDGTSRRKQAVENHKKWIDAAAYLGCHSVRVNAYSDGTPEQAGQRVAESLRHLVEYADPMGLNVIVENHGELTSNGAWLAKTIRSVG